MAIAVPIIDLSDPRASEAIDRACRDVGFFGVTGHGVPVEVVAAAWDASRRFFDLPTATRMEAYSDAGPYGYEPMESETLGRTLDRALDAGEEHPDPKQTFNLGPPYRGPDSGFGQYQRVWPTEPYDLRITWLSYYSEMERLADTVLGLCARAMGLPPDHFDPFTDRHLSALRALDYPEGIAAGTMRAGAHTDYGTLTVLRPDPAVGGLEVVTPDGAWVEVPKVDGGFVVNIGDLMQRWTNGRWRSTLHRVVGDPAGRRRQSMAFFHNPNWDARIDPILLSPDEQPRFEPVDAGPWLTTKISRAMR
ncbi:MAG: isopenicillin N synthase family dioxygenase [Acidimicrobiia bacterium]